MSAAPEEDSYLELPLDQKLYHKLWKARLAGHQELIALLKKRSPETEVYLNDPAIFGEFLEESNVVVLEQVVAALESLIRIIEIRNPLSHNYVTSLIDNWVPKLVEKGLGSSRNATKMKASECILSLCALDTSINATVYAILPFQQKKLPKLVSSATQCLQEVISSFGLDNIPEFNTFFVDLLTPLTKLAGHADKNVRSNTINLIVEIFKFTGKDKSLLQDLLLDNLKPIQQRDLDNAFHKVMDQPAETKRLFDWKKKELLALERSKAASAADATTAQCNSGNNSRSGSQGGTLDKDGDTLMEMDLRGPYKAKSRHTNNVDPFTLLPEETILDKLVEGFDARITSTVWKERVEVLEEFYEQVLNKTKRIKYKGQDYSSLLQTYASIISKDANVQAVTLAAQSVTQICSKLKLPGFVKNYAMIVFPVLLERTKEKKHSVITAIKECLQTIVKFHNPIDPHNDDMLMEICKHIKHKTPQVRMVVTELFTFVLRNNDYHALKLSQTNIIPFLEDEIIPSIVKIVNDTQPDIRNCGFECFATLIKVTNSKIRVIMDHLDKFDALKRKKIEDLLSTLPNYNLTENDEGSSETGTFESQTTSHINSDNLGFRQEALFTTSIRPNIRKQLGGTTLIDSPNNSSTIPSKRVASSPLRTNPAKSATPPSHKLSSPMADVRSSLKRQASNLAPRAPGTTGSTPGVVPSQVQQELESLRRKQKDWQESKAKLDNEVTRLSKEAVQAQESYRRLQAEFDAAQAEWKTLLQTKESDITKMRDRILQLEQANEFLQRRKDSRSENTPAIADRHKSRSSSHTYTGSHDAPSDRRLSVNSDDLPQRVDSLRLHSQSGTPVSSRGGTMTTITDPEADELSWRRAAEVTSKLKARIELMRQRTRGTERQGQA